jgi:hypothetical protein
MTALQSPGTAVHRVGWGFISLYTVAYMSTSLLFLAPLCPGRYSWAHSPRFSS